MKRTIFLGILMIFLLGGSALFAQAVTGTIFGTVRDSTGALVAGAQVIAVNVQTGETYTAKANGVADYLFLAMPVGNYRIEAEAPSFSRTVLGDVRVDVNQNARADVVLRPGAASEDVVVTTAPPVVDTRESQVSDVIDTRRANNLPLNGRNMYGLTSLLPGISTVSLTFTPDITEGDKLSINGARPDQTTFLLDGSLNVSNFRNGGLNAPNPDAVEEFRVITSNYNAEYGRSAGGVINVITKSGTNDLHGMLFEYLRNNAFDSAQYFHGAAPLPAVSPLKQNQFGGNLGGPIKHDKLFYFLSYQGFRQIAGQFVSTVTPNAAERGLVGSANCPAGSADFSAVTPAIVDPSTKAPFPNGCIPKNRLDPVAMASLQNIAMPNAGGSSNTLNSAANNRVNSDEYLGKVTYNLNQAHQLSAGLFMLRSTAFYPFTNSLNATNLPNYNPMSDTANQYNVFANETWTIKSNLLNQATYSYTRVFTFNVPQNHFGLPTWGSQYVDGTKPDVPPQMAITGGWRATSNGQLNDLEQNFQYLDTLNWVRGHHDIRIGGSLVNGVIDHDTSRLGSGYLTVSNANTKNVFSDYEMGLAANLQVSNEFIVHLNTYQWAGFIQDDWKANSRLTVNLGLRYEVFTPWTSVDGQLQQFQFNQQSTVFPNAPKGLVYPGDSGVPNGLVGTRYNEFSPRVGFAYDVFGNGRTAVRGGFGIFRSFLYAGNSFYAEGQPYQINLTVPAPPSFVNPFQNAGGNPFPIPAGKFVTPVTANWMAQNYTEPYVEQYNLTIEHQLTQKLSVKAMYLGNQSRHLEDVRDANYPVYGPGATTANYNTRRPYMPGTFAEISKQETEATANYNALQLTLNQQLSHGISLLANYAYSRAMDIESADDQTNTQSQFEDSNNLGLDYGVSLIDLRHVFNFSLIAQSPRLNHMGLVGRDVIGGWQFNTIARLTSGTPYNITSGTDTNDDGTNNDRPNLIAPGTNPFLSNSRPKEQRVAQWFNPGCTCNNKNPTARIFTLPATGTDGQVHRDYGYGPGFMQWDMSFFRDFHIYERAGFQFRAEAFNIFNHGNLGQPNSVLSSVNAGKITTNGGISRQIQIAIKFSF